MSDVTEIIGGQGVEAVRMFNRDEDAAEELGCSGVFVFIGLGPNSKLFGEHAALDETGGVLTGEDYQTSTPGLYAVGAARSGYHGRLVNAVGEGCRGGEQGARAIPLTSRPA